MTVKESEEDLARATGDLVAKRASYLEIKGNRIAQQKGYREHSGIDAVRFYLMQMHHWTPSQVKSMSDEDLAFAIDDTRIE